MTNTKRALDEIAIQTFEAERNRLLRIAYATTGSLVEAEDCVQEAWLRLQRADDLSTIRDVSAWLVTTIGRLALDAVGSARRQRERYVGPWLPEPLVEDLPSGDPAEQAALDESVSMALLVILERLSAAERISFLLHDVFGLSFDEVAQVVNRSPAAVRQLASRARKHVEDGRPRFLPTYTEQRQLVAAFTAACQDGDLARLVTLLDPDVEWRSDGGGKVTAAPVFAQGALPVARILVAFARRMPQSMATVAVNGVPGLALRDADGVLTVLSFTVDAGKIVALDVMRNPDKLANVAYPE